VVHRDLPIAVRSNIYPGPDWHGKVNTTSRANVSANFGAQVDPANHFLAVGLPDCTLMNNQLT